MRQKVTQSEGVPTTSSERAERNREIAEARADGKPWKSIAARFGISVKTAQRARAEHLRSSGEHLRETGGFRTSIEPAEVLLEAVEAHTWALAKLAEVEEQAGGANLAVRLGAITKRARVARELVDLLATAGLVPQGPSQWQFYREADRMGRALAHVAHDHGIAGQVLDCLRDERFAAFAYPLERNGGSR
jgi:transposase